MPSPTEARKWQPSQSLALPCKQTSSPYTHRSISHTILTQYSTQQEDEFRAALKSGIERVSEDVVITHRDGSKVKMSVPASIDDILDASHRAIEGLEAMLAPPTELGSRDSLEKAIDKSWETTQATLDAGAKLACRSISQSFGGMLQLPSSEDNDGMNLDHAEAERLAQATFARLVDASEPGDPSVDRILADWEAGIRRATGHMPEVELDGSGDRDEES